MEQLHGNKAGKVPRNYGIVSQNYSATENTKQLLLSLQYGMEEPMNRYILLIDRMGNTLERSLLVLPTQVLRGE